MKKLTFERNKYGKELLIDAATVNDLDLVSDTMVLSFYTIILLEECAGEYFLDTQKIDLQLNTIIFVKPGQISNIPNSEFSKGHFLFFEGDFLDEFFQDKNFIYQFGFFHNNQTPSFLHVDNDAEFATYNNIASEIWKEIKNRTQDSPHILRSLIYYLLVKLHRAYSRQYGQPRDTVIDPVLLQFLRLMDKEVRNNLGVEQFARLLGISRVHLNNLCQRHFSKTAHLLIREQITAAIKKEIKYSTKSFSEIAYEFNFSAPSHFTRFFKQMTGHFPQAYRDDLSNW